MATIKTAPIDDKNTLKESMDKLNKNIEKLIEQKQKATVKTNSGVEIREQKLRKLEDTREDKIREENRKLRDSLGDSLLPKDIRNPGINALAGGLLGIDPAVMQAFGVDKAVGSIWNNLKAKRRTNQDNRIEARRIKRDYQTVSVNQPTDKAKYGSVIKESEETVYAKHFNELNKTLKEGFGNKKQNEAQKKEESGFFAKVLGFLAGPMMKLIAGVLLGMLAVRGINLLWNKFANSALGRLLGLNKPDEKPKEGTGRDENGRKNNLSLTDKFLDTGLGVAAGSQVAGQRFLNISNAMSDRLKLNLDAKTLNRLTPQQRMSLISQDLRYAQNAKELAKYGIYENTSTFGKLERVAAESEGLKSWSATKGAEAITLTNKGTGGALKLGGKIINKAAVPLAIGLGGIEAGSAFLEGDNRGGYGALAGTAGGLGGAWAGAAAMNATLAPFTAWLTATGWGAIPAAILHVLGTLAGGIAGGMGGDLLARRTSNAIYDANHPEEIPISTDQTLSRGAQLEETQRAIEQMKRNNDFQRNSMESLESIEKILKESQYQDRAYYNEDLQTKWKFPFSTETTPTENQSKLNDSYYMHEMRNLVFPEKQ